MGFVSGSPQPEHLPNMCVTAYHRLLISTTLFSPLAAALVRAVTGCNGVANVAKSLGEVI